MSTVVERAIISGKSVMKGMAILLVDDEPFIRLSMVDALEAVGYDVHAVASGTEGLNAIIQGIKKTARGFRNAEHFKTAIYFHCGGLDLYPHETG